LRIAPKRNRIQFPNARKPFAASSTTMTAAPVATMNQRHVSNPNAS
jgi:hypothetical protein